MKTAKAGSANTLNGPESSQAPKKKTPAAAREIQVSVPRPQHGYALVNDSFHDHWGDRGQPRGQAPESSESIVPMVQGFRPYERLRREGCHSWISAQTAGGWWGTSDAQAAPAATTPPSVEDKQQHLRMLDQMVMPDYRPYTLRPDEVPRFVEDLGRLESMRRLDPEKFFAEFAANPESKQLYDRYARTSFQPGLSRMALRFGPGTEEAINVSCFVVPEQRTVYVLQATHQHFPSDRHPNGAEHHLWYALPFEPEVIGARPGAQEALAEIKRAKASLETMISVSEITKDARIVIQHADQNYLWTGADRNPTDTKSLEQGLASYIEAFAAKADALYARGETNQMLRDIGGAAAGLAALGDRVWQQTSAQSREALHALRTRVVVELEKAS